jgi:hypothetical protein
MGGGGGAALGEAAGAVVSEVGYYFLRKEMAPRIEAEAKQMIADAIEKRRNEFDALIDSRRAEIQAEQAEGRYVTLHVVIDTTWQPTEIGTVLTNAGVRAYELVFEGGPSPKKRSPRRPGGRIGAVVRAVIGAGTTFEVETVDMVLQGTDEVARERRLAREHIEAQLETAPGKQPVEFEQLIVNALTMGDGLDDLHDYATAHRDRAGAARWEVAYWTRMVALIDGPLDTLISEAKAKRISLRYLRASAAFRLLMGSQQAGAAADPATAEYWSEVLRLIDAP